MFWEKNIGMAALVIMLLWPTLLFAGNVEKLQPSAENELEGWEVTKEEIPDGVRVTITTPEMEAIPVDESGEYVTPAEPMGFGIEVDTKAGTFTIKEEEVPSEFSREQITPQ